MSVLLPWDRKKAAEQGESRNPGNRPRLIPALVIGAAAVAAIILTVTQLVEAPAETVWEVDDGRLLAYRNGLYLVDAGDGLWLMDARGTARDLSTDSERERVILGGSGELRFTPASESERVVMVMDDDTVLTQKQSQGGVFGESWDLSAYRPSGKLSWTSRIPGAVAAVCQAGDCLAVAITDLSAAGTPSLALLDAANGKILWVDALKAGVWRSIGALENGTVVAALTSCVAAFERNGSLAWTFEPTQAILAAAIVGETTCVSLRVNRGLLTLVYPYEVTALSPVGVVSWSRPVRQEPMRLQQWMGKEAVVAIAENHVLGFKIRDGARLFAERTGASPVNLTGDKLLIRDNRGIQLVRLRSVRLPST